MTARYYVLVSEELMAMDDLVMPNGFRFIERHCPEPGQPDVYWWLVEDNDASEALNGKRVEPTISRRDDGSAYVSARRPA